MKEAFPDDLIPTHEHGAKSDIVAEKVLDSRDDAAAFFRKACERLLNVNNWKTYAGALTADFELCDETGKKVSRNVQLHDYFCIDVPGPGSLTGAGYDWVQVEAFENIETPREETLLIRVRPASNPNNDRTDTAHFFGDDSTSTFMVRRMDLKVTAEVHGRNEHPNIQADSFFDKARNAVGGAVAAIFFSKFEWKSLVNGIINYEEDKS